MQCSRPCDSPSILRLALVDNIELGFQLSTGVALSRRHLHGRRRIGEQSRCHPCRELSFVVLDGFKHRKAQSNLVGCVMLYAYRALHLACIDNFSLDLNFVEVAQFYAGC